MMSLSKPINHNFTLENTGRGTWYLLHLALSRAKTDEEKKACLFLIRVIAANFFCLKCRGHFNDFIKKDPPEQYLSEEKGLSVWSWRAQNNVNSMQGKPQFSWEDYEALYYGGLICAKDCGEDGKTTPSQASVDRRPMTTGVATVLPRASPSKEASKTSPLPPVYVTHPMSQASQASQMPGMAPAPTDGFGYSIVSPYQ